jgi:hypothetical protein
MLVNSMCSVRQGCSTGDVWERLGVGAGGTCPWDLGRRVRRNASPHILPRGYRMGALCRVFGELVDVPPLQH